MKTEPKIIAQFLATIAWADEEYSAVEKSTLQSIAERMGLPELPQNMDHFVDMLQHFSGTEVTSSLAEIAPQVHADDKEELLTACVQMMGCDDYLADEEITNFFVIANIIGIEEERAISLLSCLTTEDEVVVDE
ncbi:MAG: TerB family tellurite resistance protein [Bacteroidales bacterium]|nr:TerB family tellurite resistance protein [Bacteroidales bacterium]